MPIRLRVFGKLTVTGPDGSDLTPAGSRKGLGLIALVAMAPQMRCTRTEVQALL